LGEAFPFAVPGGEFYDTDVTTVDSPHSSLNHSRDDGPTAISHEIEDYLPTRILSTISNPYTTYIPEKCIIERWIEATDDRALHVDVQMSPHTNAVQACITPSEWKSVNDMPRTNRIPLTRRITPLKDRVKEGNKSKDLIHRYLSATAVDSAANVLMTDLVESGSSSNNSSNVSVKGVKDTKNLSGNITGSNDLIDVKGNNSDSEKSPKKNVNEIIQCCGCSDISNGDEQTLADSACANINYVGKISRGASDDSLYSDVENESENENESACNSDSDNDLGHFYTLPPPLTNSDNLSIRSIISNSASLGYIVSYPSIPTSPTSPIFKS
jgi:predicted small secreted protein